MAFLAQKQHTFRTYNKLTPVKLQNLSDIILMRLERFKSSLTNLRGSILLSQLSCKQSFDYKYVTPNEGVTKFDITDMVRDLIENAKTNCTSMLIIGKCIKNHTCFSHWETHFVNPQFLYIFQELFTLYKSGIKNFQNHVKCRNQPQIVIYCMELQLTNLLP